MKYEVLSTSEQEGKPKIVTHKIESTEGEFC